MKSLFNYTDYRTYLSDFYKDKKAKEKFTYRKFAELTGVNSSSWLLLLIQGRKNLSADSAIKISRALGHTPAETEYFECLVQFTQAKTHEAKNHYFARIAETKKRLSTRKKLNIRLIAEDQYEYYSAWYHPVVRSLITKIGFVDNYQELAASLIPAITVRQARRSVKLLKRLGLIEQNGDGTWRQVGKVISTGDEVDSLNIMNYHKQNLGLALDVFESCSRDERDISNLTLGVSEENFRLIKASVQAFRKQVMKIAENSRKADRVYQFSMQLFPVGRAGGKGADDA